MKATRKKVGAKPAVPRKKAAAKQKAAPRKTGATQSAKSVQIVFDEWQSFVGTRGDVTMLIAFDDEVTRRPRPKGMGLCARIVIRMQSPDDSGAPVSPERERLWDMEDEVVGMLQEDQVRCRLIARLTYGGWREIVFQVHGWTSFRPPVGAWMMRHKDYKLEVYEHKGWEFFDEYVNPTAEDRLFIADQNVIEVLVQNGSDPEQEHSLEYAFQGEAKGLRRLAKALLKRGYEPLRELDYDSGQIELAKRLTLDVFAVNDESLANDRAAQKAGVECVGWGALSVS